MFMTNERTNEETHHRAKDEPVVGGYAFDYAYFDVCPCEDEEAGRDEEGQLDREQLHSSRMDVLVTGTCKD